MTTEVQQPDPRNRISVEALAQMIDHTLLRPDATEEQVAVLCAEARQYKFFSVCINPVHVKFAVRELAGSDVKVCTVAGFPLGASVAAVKAFEAQQAVNHGAREVDMVINIGALKGGDFFLVQREVADIARHAHTGRALCKVIIEAVLLTDAEKVKACELAKEAGADFVKTSTGFAGGGATVYDVRLMRRTVGAKMGVKAAGGIRNLEDAIAMIDAGATRLGTSGGAKIINEYLSPAPAAQTAEPAGY